MADFLTDKQNKSANENEIKDIKMSVLESFDWLERPPMVEEIEENEEEIILEPQVSPNTNRK